MNFFFQTDEEIRSNAFTFEEKEITSYKLQHYNVYNIHIKYFKKEWVNIIDIVSNSSSSDEEESRSSIVPWH